MRFTGSMTFHKRAIFLHGRVGNPVTLMRNASRYMRLHTNLESGMTGNAVSLSQSRIELHLSSVRKGSCDEEVSEIVLCKLGSFLGHVTCKSGRPRGVVDMAEMFL